MKFVGRQIEVGGAAAPPCHDLVGQIRRSAPIFRLKRLEIPSATPRSRYLVTKNTHNLK
jgi:hypothetical protein